MSTTRKTTLISVVALLLAGASPALAQYENGYPHPFIQLEGPRFGFTLLSSGMTNTLKTDRKIDVAPVITQFGWQLERQFPSGHNDIAALMELVVLVGGLDQNVALPSASWVFGARTKSGFEFGVGPNVTAVGTAIVYVAGMTHKVGTVNVPLNVSFVPSVSGVRTSVLTGFNLSMFSDW